MENAELHIAFIGFGEAARAFSGSFNRDTVTEIKAFDIKTDGPERDAMFKQYLEHAVTHADTLESALEGANVVFSLVTADAAHAVATQAGPHLDAGALFFDCNSCAPQTKQRSARAVHDAGARYVDVAIMAPVRPSSHRTPLLLSGEHAPAAQAVFEQLDMNAGIEPGPVGTSSSVKMVRSIMVKGLEALFAECFLAGRLAGVDEKVLASLEASHPGFEWAERAGYNLERMANHGERRAAEMEEVCDFLRHLGIEQPLSAGTARWQKTIGELDLTVDAADYQTTADALINALNLKSMKEIQS